MPTKWFSFKNRKTGASVTCKGWYEGQARDEAADRMDCEREDLICTGSTPLNARMIAVEKTGVLGRHTTL